MNIRYIATILILSLLNILINNAQDNELSLSRSIELAMEKNYGIIISRYSVNEAAINNKWGTAGLYPGVEFNLSSNNEFGLNNDNSTNRLNADLGMQWTLFDGFRIIITKDKLQKLEEISKGNLAVIVESTIQDIILEYYNVLFQKEKLDLFNKIKLLSKDRYDYELTRQSIGGAVTQDVLQAKTEYLNDKALYMNQEVVYRNAIRNLNLIMGIDSVKTWRFTETFEADTNKYILQDLLDKMLSNNQNLKNQYVNILLQENEVKLRKSELYPSLSLDAGLNNMYEDQNSKLSGYGNIRLSYSIFSGGNRKRAIEIAKLGKEIARTENKEMIHSLKNQLYAIFDLYNMRKELIYVANASLEAAELNMQIASEKYKTGTINSFNYRDIQLNYLNTSLLKLEAIYNFIDAQTNLTRITGGFIREQ